MSAININKNNFQNEIMDSEKTVLLDFWAPWCAPCRMVAPIIEEIASERPDIKVGKNNVDEQPELASKFGIMSIPTLVVMKNGKIVLDVRTPQEYQEGHIPESKNVPLQQLNNVVSVVKNTEIPLFVYCYSGARSRQATGMLQRMGYSKVNNIGGIAAYSGKVEK